MLSTEQKASDEQVRELNRIVRAAALKIDHTGSLRALADKAKIKYPGLSLALRRGYMSTGMAAAIVLAVGEEHITMEMLCPSDATV